MANDNINQKPSEVQEQYKKILTDINNLRMLVIQLRQECVRISDKIPDYLKDQLKMVSLKIENDYNNFSYTINKIEDMHNQRVNKPVNIKLEEK